MTSLIITLTALLSIIEMICRQYLNVFKIAMQNKPQHG